MPPACLAPLARALRRVVTIPVCVAGRITEARVAERILEDGDADFVALGRALHADPAMPIKSRAGREAEIFPCVLEGLDLVVPTSFMVPRRDLAERLARLDDGLPLFEIGDCLRPRTAFAAMQAAAALAHRL